MTVVEAHEPLHSQTLLTVRITQTPSDQLLLRKQQLVLAATRELVHLKPYTPQEIIRLFKPEGLLTRQPVVLQHGIEVGILEKDCSCPTDDLQIPQPPNPFLDMRFKQVGRFTVLLEPFLTVLYKILKKSPAPLGAKAFQEGFAPGVIEALVTGDETRFQMAGKD